MLTLPAGRPIELAANRPLVLNDPDAVWLVQAGRVHVFAVRIEQGEPAGPRTHLFSADVGDALFGIDPSDTETRLALLAVGVPGSRLVQLGRAELWGQLLGPAPDVARLLERWVERLSVAARGQIPPRDARALAGSGADSSAHSSEVVLQDGEDARPRAGVVWVTPVEGRALFTGAEQLPLPADVSFPLSHQAWLRSVGTSRLVISPTPTVIAPGGGVEPLQAFHRLALQAVGLRVESAARAEAERLERKDAADQLALEQGFARLVAAFEPRRSVDVLLAGADDPLLAACRLVGNALGVAIHPPPRSESGRRPVAPLELIARASRVRLRPVTLAGRWWREDGGPLLGYLGPEARPVALLPTSASSYELVDPAAGTRAPLGPELASSLAPAAYMFYRPFPDRALTALVLLRFGLRGSHKDLLAVALMGLLGALLGLAFPLATGLLFDRVVPGADHSRLVQLTLALLASAFAVAAFQLTRDIAVLRIEGRMDGAIQAAVWDRLLSLPVPFYREYSSGDLALRAMGIDAIRQALSGVVATAVLTALFSVFSWGLLFFYAPFLALVATALLVFALGATALASYLQLGHLRELSRVQGRIAGLVLELMTGISKLRVAEAEQRAFSVWARAFGDQSDLVRKAQAIAINLNVFYSALPIVAMMVIFAAVAVNRGDGLSTGAFLAFNAAFGQVIAAFVGLGAAVVAALQVVPLVQRARPILDTPPEVDLARADPGELDGDVDVVHVSFRYRPDGPLALDDVSFSAEPGEFIALVGPSGSGKSTLLRLLLGFEAPESGSVHYGGQDLAGLDLRAVRRQIGVVLQSGKLMPGDIYTNIVGSAPLTVEDAWEAARMAGLAEDIERMPMGMFTVVMEGGATFSGGQRQRLMIARAIVTRPRLLLFDEATSALDNQTQAIVSRSLEGLEATRIVIAHRLSTIQKADRIYVLQAGRVVQTGTYDELMREPGPFAELARRQLA